MKRSNLVFAIVLIIILFAIAGVGYYFWQKNNADQIDSFDECKAAGYPIQESYPERCAVPGGKTFTNPNQSVQTSKTGVIECLPHKDSDGPHTLECALGLDGDDGYHYALSDPQMNFIANAPTGTKVTVTGKLTADESSIYDIAGKIEIEDLVKVD